MSDQLSKREERLLRIRRRPLDPRDQGKHLWEVVNQGRRTIELADHKARYALVVMGLVNAGVLFLVTGSEHFMDLVPVSLRPWYPVLVIPFGIMAVLFLVDAYNSLRPRPPVLRLEQFDTLDEDSLPRGLLFWNTLLRKPVESYREAWDNVQVGQLNNELAAMAYALAEAIERKYQALHRLYIELLVIILLAAALCAVPVYFSLL